MNTHGTPNRRKFLEMTTISGLSLLSWPYSLANAQTVSGLYDDLPLKDRVMGNLNAPVTLLEYASMTCPHCKAFHERVFPAIKKTYIDTGKVKFTLRPFPFDGDRRGEAAFMLALCNSDGKYYPMIDALFATQKAWARGSDPVAELKRISKLAGMSEEQFNACLNNQSLLDQMIANRNLAVQKFRVTSTPTIFIGDKKFTQSSTVENLDSALKSALSS